MYGIITHLSTRYGEDPSWEHTMSKPHESSISKPTIIASYTEKLITVTKSQGWKRGCSLLNKSKIITGKILIEEISWCRGYVDVEIEFPSGIGSRGTFQSQELSLQPRSRSMINTRKRSGCLIKEQIIYLSRKSVQHNPAMRHCWPRRARKIQGKRNSSFTLVNRKNVLIIQNVDPDMGV